MPTDVPPRAQPLVSRKRVWLFPWTVFGISFHRPRANCFSRN